ncbi:MAG: hypothetical protein MUE85_14860 [Microscillaceae bacterium]|jgi:hypothetical protein|nr:hypothetical protein [Microscillaceae bacterium]
MTEDTDEESLAANNLLKKIKLQNEFGMEMSETSLPPEAESAWLDYIISFEEQHKNAQNTTIYDFIGKPDFKPLEQILPNNLENEIERLLEIMYQNQISLDTISEVAPEAFYRFITEEFFQEEISDIRVEGMMHCFTYENYHPNHDYDLRRYTQEFLSRLLSEDREYLTAELYPQVTKANGQVIDNQEVEKILLAFKDAHKHFKLNDLTINHLEFSLAEGKAHTLFTLDYEAQNTFSGEQVHYVGEGRFDSTYDFGYWYIAQIRLPGLVI